MGDKQRWDSIIRKAQIHKPIKFNRDHIKFLHGHPNYDNYYKLNGEVADWSLDMRIPLTNGRDLNYIGEKAADMLRTPNLYADALCGMSYSGALICGAVMSRIPNLESCIWRSKKKTYGRRRMVEGARPKSVILIDDIMNSGSAKLRAIKDLKKVHVNVIGVLCVVEYGWRDGAKKLPQGVKFGSLVRLEK